MNDARSSPEIPLWVPEIRGLEWTYVREVLDSGWVSSASPFVERFEQAVAAYLDAPNAVATASGTSALHTALLATGVGVDDEVVVSTLTFIAPVNAVRYVGAWPVFADVDPEYWQMDPDGLRDFLERRCRWTGDALYNRETGRRVKAVLPVHLLGHPCDMDPIVEVARKYELVVIEDASESLGARYKGRPVGRQGDLACFSFNGNKIITAGGGGMIVTDNPHWAARARYLTTQAKDDAIEYVHGQVGFNYRLSGLQAAMGCAQLEQLDAYAAAKRRIADRYAQGVVGIPGLSVMQEAPWALSTYWLYTVLVDESRFGIGSRALLRRLAAAGIETRPLFQPAHASPAHRAAAPGQHCPTADRLYAMGLSLPSSVGLTSHDQDRVIEAIAAQAHLPLGAEPRHG